MAFRSLALSDLTIFKNRPIISQSLPRWGWSFWLLVASGTVLLMYGLALGDVLILALGLLVIPGSSAWWPAIYGLVTLDKKLLLSAGQRLGLIFAIIGVLSFALAWWLPASQISGILLSRLDLGLVNLAMVKMLVLSAVILMITDQKKWLVELLLNTALWPSLSGLAIAVRLANWPLAINLTEVLLSNILLLILVCVISFYLLAIYVSKK